jgi:N-acetylglucosamine kinase-like BadF-type ATPase
VFDYDTRGDAVADELVGLAAGHIGAIAARLLSVGATRLALVGGCAPFLKRGSGRQPKHIWSNLRAMR